MNEDYLFMKDKNDNNLLQICAKNHSTEMFAFIVERYVKCELKEEMRERHGQYILKDRLVEKNKHGKNVFDVAKLYRADEIALGLDKLREDFNMRDCLVWQLSSIGVWQTEINLINLSTEAFLVASLSLYLFFYTSFS